MRGMAVLRITPPAIRPVKRDGTALIGRERERAALCDLMLQPAARLVTLTGVGGCGKTRLALDVAEQVSTAFPHGHVFVDMTERFVDHGVNAPEPWLIWPTSRYITTDVATNSTALATR